MTWLELRKDKILTMTLSGIRSKLEVRPLETVDPLETGVCLALWVRMWRSLIGVFVALTSHRSELELEFEEGAAEGPSMVW